MAEVTDEQLLAKYRPLFDRIAADAIQRELDRELPVSQIAWLAESGMTATRIPVEQGGDGATLRQLFVLLIELATADPHIPQALRAHFAFVEDRLAAGDEIWIARFVAGELVGNAVTEIGQVVLGQTETRLDAAADGFTITGRKYYTTGSIFADWIDTTAIDPDGVEVAALVRRGQPSVTISDDWDGFGQRLTGSGTVVFDAAVVESDDVYVFSNRFAYQTAFYQLVLIAVLAGIAGAAERDVVAELQGRARAFSHGAATESRRDPQLLEAVGRISAAAAAARVVALAAASELDRVAVDPSFKRDVELDISRAQLTVIELTLRTVTALFDPLGASATSNGKALDRHWRNARTVASHNPVAFKARIIGDALVNDVEPPYEWYVGIAPARPTE